MYSEGYFEKPIILIMLKFYNFALKQFPELKILDEKFTVFIEIFPEVDLSQERGDNRKYLSQG